MFKFARIKLTAWYLLIIMVISLSFSCAVFRILTVELDRVAQLQRFRIEHRLPERLRIIPPSDISDELQQALFLDPDLINETKNRLMFTLAFINLGILGGSALAGYFLAGRTLRPIAQMVEEQKRFVADASHELRTPLSAIKTETEVSLRDKKLDLLSAKKLLNSNLEEIDKLKSLTDYFLTLSQYQNTNTQLPFEKFYLSETVFEVCRRLQKLAKGKKITIAKNLRKISIEANKASIAELITILIDNAIKYSHDNGRVKISLEEKRGHAEITVEDKGVGIKTNDLPYIFNRFYQADSSRTKNVVKGYGLGLAIAKSIVELHWGKITVKSTVNKGSKFSVSLPK
ncbi:HAMP domain-containing histidine kinase [Candidatus Microgenomates bacterium]|nr:HAMP domain-containing histidine kinase [Candidatus Microgenomates bacterium]